MVIPLSANQDLTPILSVQFNVLFSVFIADSLSCTSTSSLESPNVKNRTPVGVSSTPRLFDCSPKPEETSVTPKNSRFILEKWLKSTPSPGSASLGCFDANLPQRSALSEQRKNNRTFREKDPKCKMALCVGPLSEPKSMKRHKGTPLQLTRSSTKRKLVSDDKENPPSKTIKMCFSSTKSSPQSNEARTESDKSKQEHQTPSTRIRRPFASNLVRDVLDVVDECEEKDMKSDEDSSP